jgi:hypothetical protein
MALQGLNILLDPLIPERGISLVDAVDSPTFWNLDIVVR